MTRRSLSSDASLILSSAVLALLSSCASGSVSPATQIIVNVDSDLAIGTHLQELTITLSHPDAAEADVSDMRTVALSKDEPPPSGKKHLPLAFSIKPGGAPRVMIHVVGRGVSDDDANLRTLVEQRSVVSFQEHQTVLVRMFLAAVCVDEFCDGDSALSCYPSAAAGTASGACGSVAALSERQGKLLSATELDALQKNGAMLSAGAGDDKLAAAGRAAAGASGEEAKGTAGEAGAMGGAGGESGASGGAGREPEPPSCEREHGGCDTLVSCDDSSGRIVCGKCPSGYSNSSSGKGEKCTDIDECAAGSSNCKLHSSCLNTSGGYACPCAMGYSGDGKEACHENARCDAAKNDCGSNAQCRDVDGVKRCVCDSGFEGGDGKACADVDECNTDNGQCGDKTYARCINNPGAPPTCEPVDVCATNNGGCGDKAYASCSNQLGMRPACSAVDVCSTNNGGCGAAAQYRCTNHLGAPPSCADVDECQSAQVCNAESPCLNLTGCYTCRGRFADWAPSDSPSSFSAQPNGTVRDLRTNLTWQRAIDGWYTWSEAKAYCESLTLASAKWRLPTKAELESLLDFTRSDPAINTDAFPNTPSSHFWTSTSGEGVAASSMWFVSFNGGDTYIDDTTAGSSVRCVQQTEAR